MPTRKQRRRALKERRHEYEYETVWIDPVSGEEVEPPEDYVDAPHEKPERREKRDDGKPKAKSQPQRGSRPVRVPPPPSWRRAIRRSLILGGVIFVAFYLLGSKSGGNRLAGALSITLIYVVLFIPFTFFIDRFSHNRWQRRAEQQGQKGSAKKR
jgi:hypothetical protein